MDKTVLITGANRGLGLEYAKQYAEAGWRVYATARDVETATTLKSLASAHNGVQLYALDVSNQQAIYALAKELAAVTFDVIISNAGTYPESRFGRTNAGDWIQAFQINAFATYFLAEAFLPHLQRSRAPKLIAMTSKMGSIADNSSGGEYIYRSSKTALNMVVKSLAIDLQSLGLIVAALHPGWVRTDMGGLQGLIDCQTSVTGLRQVIANLNHTHNGAFIAYDGQSIPW